MSYNFSREVKGVTEQILAVQRMQDYIAEHIGESIAAAELARAAQYSPWYSYRLFTRLTGYTPSDYIRRYRLSLSALMLRDGGCRVIDAALEAGFDSADGYTRAFYREFGCKPFAYARSRVPLTLFVPYGVKFREMRKEVINMENVQSVFIQKVTKPARRVIIKRAAAAHDYFSYCDEVGCDVWGMLLSMDSLCGEPVCMWLPEKLRAGASEYVQGVEVSQEYSGQIPEGFDVIDLPEAEYLMFRGEPFKEEDYCEAIEAVRHAADRYDPSFIGCEWDERSPSIQLEPRCERGYIELRAVKER